MADVVISYSRENEATVRQLADALAREGYEVWRDDAPAPSPDSADRIAEQIGRAKAVVVVWSEAAAASEWVRAEANVARGLKKLVQASADDAAPPIPFDPAQSASISDWLGAPDHPGWLRIRQGVAALAGPPPSDERTVIALAPAAAGLPAPAAAPPPPPAPAPPPPVAAPPLAAATVAAPRGKSKLVPIVAILVLLVAVVAGGGLAWQKGWVNVPGFPSPQADGAAEGLTSTLPPGPGEPATSAETPPASQSPAATAAADTDANAVAPAAGEDQFTQESVIRNAQGFALVRSAPDGGGLTIGRINANEAFSTYPQEGGWWRVRTASGTIGYVEAASIRSRAQLQADARAAEERRRPTGPRINRQNSENMRLFCAGPGVGTPQCRTFARQVRNQAR